MNSNRNQSEINELNIKELLALGNDELFATLLSVSPSDALPAETADVNSIAPSGSENDNPALNNANTESVDLATLDLPESIIPFLHTQVPLPRQSEQYTFTIEDNTIALETKLVLTVTVDPLLKEIKLIDVPDEYIKSVYQKIRNKIRDNDLKDLIPYLGTITCQMRRDHKITITVDDVCPIHNIEYIRLLIQTLMGQTNFKYDKDKIKESFLNVGINNLENNEINNLENNQAEIDFGGHSPSALVSLIAESTKLVTSTNQPNISTTNLSMFSPTATTKKRPSSVLDDTLGLLTNSNASITNGMPNNFSPSINVDANVAQQTQLPPTNLQNGGSYTFPLHLPERTINLTISKNGNNYEVRFSIGNDNLEKADHHKLYKSFSSKTSGTFRNLMKIQKTKTDYCLSFDNINLKNGEESLIKALTLIATKHLSPSIIRETLDLLVNNDASNVNNANPANSSSVYKRHRN